MGLPWWRRGRGRGQASGRIEQEHILGRGVGGVCALFCREEAPGPR